MEFQPRNHKRDLDIMYLRNKYGWTFTAIGNKYNISKARVRQLYYRIMAEKRMEAESRKMGIGA